MRFPRECYQMETELLDMLPQLRPAQRQGLALWVYGATLAQSACQDAVIAALATYGRWHTIRDHLREWLFDGADRAAPCRTQLTVTQCFAPLLQWILARWEGQQLALAIDVTYRGGDITALVISVLYRGTAIPVAWKMLRCNAPGAWMPEFERLLALLAPVVPKRLQVLVLLDAGLRGAALWQQVRSLGWHPLVRQRIDMTFRPAGYRKRVPARSLVSGPGRAWVGQGVAFKHRPYRRAGTLIVVWAEDAPDPWVLLTDLPPHEAGVWWYGLRMWIELGFRMLKGVGWQWQRTRRTNLARAERHWLVLAVASAWVLAYGTHLEERGDCYALPPWVAALAEPHPKPHRPLSLARLGRCVLCIQLLRGRLWRRLCFRPDPWPDPPPTLLITYHECTPG